MSKLNALDQYFTAPHLAERYMETVFARYGKDRTFLEPSAGDGAFLKPLVGLSFEAFDLEPKSPGIISGDFFDVILPKIDYITIGNPPFTFDVQFFNKCALHSDAICFVIPRSWRKASVINRLDKFFHLVHDEDCPTDAFLLNGEEWDVTTCFQIWERKDYPRDKIKFQGTYFDVVPYEGEWDIVLRTYGSRSGEVLPDDYPGNQTTVRFLKSKIDGLKEIISSIDWSVRKSNVSSLPTINPIEIELEIEGYLNGYKELYDEAKNITLRGSRSPNRSLS